MTQLTDSGFERTRLTDRISDLAAELRAIFGSDIDLSSDTMDGQHMALYAEAIADLDELAEMVWVSFDPDLTTGSSLSRIVKLNGIERSQGTYSVVDLTMLGAPQTLIPERSIVSNASGTVEVYTLSDTRINDLGVAYVQASPLSMGPISAPAQTITSIKTPLYGWASATNEAPMTIGKQQESDQNLRVRRRISVSKGNRNMTEALTAALLDLAGVIEAKVLENATPYTDNRGLPPHSIHAVVLGGNQQQIAQTIWVNKTGGTVLAGQQSIDIVDQEGGVQTMKFSRPKNIPAKIKVYITPKSGWSYNSVNLIKQTLVDWIAINQTVGDELVNSSLYTPLNNIGGFSIDKIELARVGDNFAEQSLPVKFYERISVDILDIEVTQ